MPVTCPIPTHPAPHCRPGRPSACCLRRRRLQISPTHLRGTLGSINQLCICLGILAALLVNVALPAAAWRTMFALSALPGALLGVGEWAAAAMLAAGAVLLLPRRSADRSSSSLCVRYWKLSTTPGCRAPPWCCFAAPHH